MSININRPTISYENIALLKGSSPSYSINSNSGSSINLIPFVQDFSFSFDTKTEDVLTLGDKFYSKRVNRYDVDVNLDVTILETFENMFSGFFSGSEMLEDLNQDCSFYTALGKRKRFSDFSDFDETVNFGNAFLKNFSLNQSTKQFLTSKYSYTCSNTTAEIKQGSPGTITNPAINLTGNQLQDLTSTLPNVQSLYEGQGDVQGELFPSYGTSIHISGVKNENTFLVNPDMIQNFSLDIPFGRKKIFKIGKKYPIARKFTHTTEGGLSLSTKTSEFYLTGQESNLKDFLQLNDDYVISIKFTNMNSVEYDFEISGARLASNSQSMSLSEDLNSSFSFDFNLFDFKKV
mgnify:FL=1|tara:strand:+ start:1583 stop:2626 length:1044 start_codon:yes stop_codon:yes gene_type:complete